jgi:hypothetical protein
LKLFFQKLWKIHHLRPPPSGNLSILEHLVASYKLWHEIKSHIQKSSRYTLGEKIDNLFIETLELIFIAQYLSKPQKLPALEKANTKFDALKFFLRILWEIDDISKKQYLVISEKLNEIGRMLGGWLRKLEAEAARDINNRARPNG